MGEGEGEGLQDRGEWRYRSGGSGETPWRGLARLPMDRSVSTQSQTCLDMCGG